MSTPDAQDKKVPQFSSFTMRPATAPAESCCTDHACATESAPAAEALDDARYSWQVDGMDCAACARKVETAVRQVPGVSQVQVLFATEKLLVNAEGDIRAQVENAVRQAGYTLRDADAPAAEKTRGSLLRDNLPLLTLVIMMALSWGLEQANHPAGQLAFVATTLVGLWPVARQALRLIKSGSWFAIETLMSVAAIGALFIGATAEAAMVLLLFLIGERLESWAASRARQGVSALMALKPDTAIRLRNGVRETVAQRDLRPGDVIEVAAGGRLPADGQLLSPFASFDESALTGESVPVERQAGERVAAGATSVDRLVQLTVISEPGDSAIDRILKLIEEAEERRAPIERFIDRFSRIYTPAIMVVALLVAIVPPLFFASAWLPWIYKGLTLLLIGCPCALVISTPAAITSGLAVAARRGALIKGGAALEQLGQVRQVAFDKTGTLTVGQPQVTSVIATAEFDDNALLALAAAVEQGSSHPLAQAIVREAQRRQLSIPLASSQRAALAAWLEEYPDQLGIALTDCITMDAFLRDFGPEFATRYQGLRHDSGDPVEWGEKAIAHYQKLGIDPLSKVLVFSDNLDLAKAVDLYRHFASRVKLSFVIGTRLTCDLPQVKPLNIVIKLVECNGKPVAKLSDSPGKTICHDKAFVRALREAFDLPPIKKAS